MKREDINYRAARRCGNCHWGQYRQFGSQVGPYCTKWLQRCSKYKVCDSHITDEEYRVFTEWPENLEGWRDEPKSIVPRQ